MATPTACGGGVSGSGYAIAFGGQIDIVIRNAASAYAGVRAVWGPPVMGPPGPHNARDMGTGGAQISSVIGTGGPRISGDMGIL